MRRGLRRGREGGVPGGALPGSTLGAVESEEASTSLANRYCVVVECDVCMCREKLFSSCINISFCIHVFTGTVVYYIQMDMKCYCNFVI